VPTFRSARRLTSALPAAGLKAGTTELRSIHGIRVAFSCRVEEDTLSKRAYGVIAGVIGSAIGAWWYARQRAASMSAAEPDRGTVIFHNTPTPTPLSSEGVI